MRNISQDNSAHRDPQITMYDKAIASYKTKIECNKSMIHDLFVNWFCPPPEIMEAYYSGMMSDSDLIHFLNHHGEDKENMSLNSQLLAMSSALINLRDNMASLMTLENQVSSLEEKLKLD